MAHKVATEANAQSKAVAKIINEIALKYHLDIEDAKVKVEEAIAYYFSKYIVHEDCDCNLVDGVVYIYTNAEVKTFVLQQLHKKLLKNILYHIRKKLIEYELIQKRELYKGLVKTIMQGEIVAIDEATKSLQVRMEYCFNNIKPDILIGRCAYHSTPVKERLHYKVGMTLPFLITSLKVNTTVSPPFLEFQLSRNSKTFVELIARQAFQGLGQSITCECIKRIAGGYSVLLTNQKIPVHVIKQLSQQIGEGIIVKYGKDIRKAKRAYSG